MNTRDWLWNTQLAIAKNGIENKTIISSLLSSNKIQLSTIVGDMAFQLVYFTIGNLNYETRKQCRKLDKLLLCFIPIHHEDNIDVKLDIYHTCLRIMIKCEQNYSNLAVNTRKILCYQ